MDINSINKVFFIGIGGIGMSALAKYFIKKNIKVYGYDKEKSFITDDLIKLGADVSFDYNDISVTQFIDDKENNLIIYTPAISNTHLIYKLFKNNGFNILKRSEVLELISNKSKCIAVAGTHGKTTTTSILAHILKEANFSFCAFIGGILVNYNSNFLYNGEDYMLIEADEFDRSFLRLKPEYACITSIDIDHLDVYKDSKSINNAFMKFKNNIVKGGFLVSNESVDIKSIKYGTSENSDFTVKNFIFKKNYSQFDLCFDNSLIENLKINMCGIHNVMNATAAISIALKLQVSVKKILKALKSFKGIERRFSYKINKDSLVLIDDYAHHPEEINQVYKTLRSIYPGEKILVVFQPHLYSRTRDLLNEFAVELSKFYAVLLLDIYPARENPIEGISSNILLDKIDSQVKFLCSKSEVSNYIKNLGLRVNITLGAGDIANEVDNIKNELEYAV